MWLYYFPINNHIFIKQLTRLLNLHLLQVIGEGEVTLIFSILPRFVTLIYNDLFLWQGLKYDYNYYNDDWLIMRYAMNP